jgi:hypothetical protein
LLFNLFGSGSVAESLDWFCRLLKDGFGYGLFDRFWFLGWRRYDGFWLFLRSRRSAIYICLTHFAI